MSDSAESQAPQLARVTGAVGAASAGALLRSAREAAGLHIGALAVSLKVPVKKLEALEGDRFDLLPDAVFARALASSVCRTLKIDPAPVLLLLPHSTPAPLRADDRGINAPFSSSADLARTSMFEQLSRPVVLTALALSFAAVVLVFFPIKEAGQAMAPAAVTPVLAAAPAPVMDSAASPLQADPTPAASGGPVGAALSTALPDPPVNAVPARASPVPTVATSSAPSAAAAILGLRARGDSWIEVTDAARVVQFSRIMRSGESVAVSGTLPLAVSIGRADMTEVQVRGKALDLQPWSKDNVARFEVK